GVSGSLGIVITGLSHGTLEFSAQPGAADAVWTRVDLDSGYHISREDIQAGKLRFVPDTNESGWNGAAGNGVGNLGTDYAHLDFRPDDGQAQGAPATLHIDVLPVADAPVLSVAVG